MKATLRRMIKMKRWKWMAGICILIAAVTAAAIFSDWGRPSEQTAFLMDTQARIVIYDGGNQEAAMEGAFSLLRKLDGMMNVHNPESELSLLNQEGERMVSPELFSVIERGLYFSQLSGGVFDITIRPLTELWDFKQQTVPEDALIKEAMRKVDYRNVTLRTDHTVVLHNGTQLDLGGIAKGYAADQVCGYLREQGIQNALVDIGGNIKALGSGSKGDGYRIGLQNPDSQRGSYFATLSVKDASVVSSGVYERNFEKDGQRYHHIIDTRTGRPLQNGIIASTVVTESSMDADALSTIVMLLGEQEGIQLAESIPGVECILVREDKNLFVTQELKREINITDSTYLFKE